MVALSKVICTICKRYAFLYIYYVKSKQTKNKNNSIGYFVDNHFAARAIVPRDVPGVVVCYKGPIDKHAALRHALSGTWLPWSRYERILNTGSFTDNNWELRDISITVIKLRSGTTVSLKSCILR